MEAVVLGSAQDAGVPQLLCACPACDRARRDPARRRLASSVLVRSGNRAWLLDASPDVRHQLAAFPPGLDLRIFLTHAHAGHLAGLLQFGKEGPWRELPVFATPRLAGFLRGSPPFRDLLERLVLREVLPDGAVEDGGARFVARPIRHRAEHADVVAWEVQGPARRLLYLPDTDRLDAPALAAIGALGPGDVALVDGTFWSATELPGRDLAEVPHPFVQDAMDVLEPHRARGVRVLFTHLNHSNPLADPASRERADVAARGFEVAEDGLAIRLA